MTCPTQSDHYRAERHYAGLLLCVVATLLVGCYRNDDVATKATQLGRSSSGAPASVRNADVAEARARNALADSQMDSLDEVLNQHLEQWPSLESPIDRDNPLVMSVEESQMRLDQALASARQGDLATALKRLSVVRCHPNLYVAWSNLFAELQAVRFQQDKIFPLAARFAAASLLQNPRSAAGAIRESLCNRSLWAWKYEGTTQAMLMPKRAGALPDDPPSSFFRIQGYTNRDESVEVDGVSHRPHQVFHFCVFLTTTGRHVLSFVVQRQKLAGGDRIYFLERQVQGRPEVLEVYDSVPDYARAVADVKAQIEKPANKGTSS